MFFLIVCIVLTLIIFFFAGKIVFNSSMHEEIKCRMGTVRWLACVIIDSILKLLLF